jgi:hypothetical protein
VQEVVNFCRKHLTANAEAFRSSRLDLVINCARSVSASIAVSVSVQLSKNLFTFF